MGVDDDRSDDEYACRRACRHDVVVVGWSLIALRLMTSAWIILLYHGWREAEECCDRALRYKSTKSTTIDTIPTLGQQFGKKKGHLRGYVSHFLLNSIV